MASAKRELPRSDEPQFKKAKVSENKTSQFLSHGNLRVVLNPADCDIDFNVEGNGLRGSALYEEGFAYCWSGSRANIGITEGKYCFGCKILLDQPVDMEDTPLDQQHVCRIGISRGDDAVQNLGESMHSFGFGGTGKFSNSGNFLEYGEKFGVGDVIICAVDLEKKPMASIGFFKNGKWLGVAKHFDAGPSGLGVVGSPINKLQWESALFPHVLLKNAVVQLQFSIDDGLIPEEGYKPWAAAIMDGNSILGPGFSNQHNCEVIMMVGLPASGKTTWAETWVKEHPDKRYVLLGTDLVLEQMKLPGLLHKRNFSERFKHLMDRATKIFNVLLSRASRISRNFILDQTNVYKSARKRKLKPFAFYVKIAVVVFPRPEMLMLRADNRSKEMGKEVPAEAVNEMLANYTLPTSKDMPMADEYFDQVLFVELSRTESQRSLDEMKRDMHCQKTRQFTRFQSDAFDCGHSSDSYQNQSGAPSGKYFPTPFSYDSRCDFDNIGSCSGYNCTKINDHQSRVPSHDGIDEVFRSFVVDDAFRHTGVESRDFLHNVPVDLSQRNIADPITTSLPYNTCYGGYAVGSGGTPCDLSVMRHPAYQPASPSPHGSYGIHIPPPPFGNFPTDVQHTGVYPSPSPLKPLHGNFPVDVRRL